MQSTLPLGPYGWLNTVYEISRMHAPAPEITGQVPVERCSPLERQSNRPAI
ncbi:hypothetical protein AWB69_03917 [Caballeronia udeis]|uniref:Uncharacterized protein n=1 Tax=Caballeronia udeis TaxID=1232866 RepID=A0A158H564_9BURK|nr:hypothetical protein AWB69_03917 [Caballeronia udeis]